MNAEFNERMTSEKEKEIIIRFILVKVGNFQVVYKRRFHESGILSPVRKNVIPTTSDYEINKESRKTS